MYGLRNRIIHDYFEVDLDVVWQTIQRYDPCAAFNDLVCVMEAPCPVWPQRPPTTGFNVAVL